jgi:hypothetical protein
MARKPNPTTPRRIYLVRHADTGAERLVRALTPAQARNHAARDTITVAVATQDQLVTLLTSGDWHGEVEDAAPIGEDAANPAEAPEAAAA